ncbi:hypothetical protein K449DRAFT_427732 [Hypoxylon sp. EC38]|nr:hypothetical protein K449DRAFT_427732 [Hypoxylon sp. EC38]
MLLKAPATLLAVVCNCFPIFTIQFAAVVIDDCWVNSPHRYDLLRFVIHHQTKILAQQLIPQRPLILLLGLPVGSSLSTVTSA